MTPEEFRTHLRKANAADHHRPHRHLALPAPGFHADSVWTVYFEGSVSADIMICSVCGLLFAQAPAEEVSNADK